MKLFCCLFVSCCCSPRTAGTPQAVPTRTFPCLEPDPGGLRGPHFRQSRTRGLVLCFPSPPSANSTRGGLGIQEVLAAAFTVRGEEAKQRKWKRGKGEEVEKRKNRGSGKRRNHLKNARLEKGHQEWRGSRGLEAQPAGAASSSEA